MTKGERRMKNYSQNPWEDPDWMAEEQKKRAPGKIPLATSAVTAAMITAADKPTPENMNVWKDYAKRMGLDQEAQEDPARYRDFMKNMTPGENKEMAHGALSLSGWQSPAERQVEQTAAARKLAQENVQRAMGEDWKRIQGDTAMEIGHSLQEQGRQGALYLPGANQGRGQWTTPEELRRAEQAQENRAWGTQEFIRDRQGVSRADEAARNRAQQFAMGGDKVQLDLMRTAQGFTAGRREAERARGELAGQTARAMQQEKELAAIAAMTGVQQQRAAQQQAKLDAGLAAKRIEAGGKVLAADVAGTKRIEAAEVKSKWDQATKLALMEGDYKKAIMLANARETEEERKQNTARFIAQLEKEGKVQAAQILAANNDKLNAGIWYAATPEQQAKILEVLKIKAQTGQAGAPAAGPAPAPSVT
jgi:hypothetical protein